MGAFGGLILTNKGKALQAKAQTGTQLNFTRFGVGDGSLGGQQIANLNALISEKKSLPPIKLKTMPGGKAIVGCVLTNQDVITGFYLRELGVFAQDPDEGEILYCYGNAGSGAEYIPPGDGADTIEKYIDAVTIVGNAASVTASIDESLVYVLQQEFDGKFNETTGHTHDGTPGNGPKLDPLSALTYVPVNKDGDELTGNLTIIGALDFGAAASAYITGKTTPHIYNPEDTFNGVSGNYGSLVLQSRSTGANRPIIFVTGTTPAERMRIDTSGVQFAKDSSLTNDGSGNTSAFFWERNSASPAGYFEQNGTGDILRLMVNGNTVAQVKNDGNFWSNGNLVWHDGGKANRASSQVYRNADGGISANTWVRVTFTASDYNNGGRYDTGLGRFTPGNAGLFLIAGSLQFTGLSAGSRYIIAIYRNNVEYKRLVDDFAPSGNVYQFNFAGTAVSDDTNDYFEIWVFTSVATTVKAGNVNSFCNFTQIA